MSIKKYFARLPVSGQLGKSTWHTVLSIYTFECHSGSQQNGDEDTASSQSRSEAQQEARGKSKVFSRGENNVPRNKDRPLLYFLASIYPSSWCRQDIDLDPTELDPTGDPVRVFDAWVPYFFSYVYTKFPLTQLEIIVSIGNRSHFSVFHRHLLRTLKEN